jgi:hypothetical protein
MPSSTPLAPLALLVTLAILPTQTLFSQPVTARQHRGVRHEPLQSAASANFPVTSVSLYKNGVGYFEHSGQVSGDARVTVDFTTDQLNDVLQSLTAVDLGGGRISGAAYNSTTPLEQQLKSLPIALGEDPTAADFYAAIRGARVQVTGPGVNISGRLFAVEDRTPVAKAADDVIAGKGSPREFLTVISDSGEVRTLELTQSVSVRLLDTSLHADVTRYLQLIADNRSEGLRHLTLTDRGKGSRTLDLSYISAVPVWKSTYRILLTDAQGSPTTATLQGLAVVDNTTGEDWNNVHLSLIAGSPQSFTQPLSTPIYTQRPEIPIAEEAQIVPTTHDSSISMDALAAPKLLQPEMRVRGLSGGSAGGVLGGVMGGVAGGYGRGFGSGTGAGAAAEPAFVYEQAAADSLATSATTTAFDDFFAYKLGEPVTILKNESALVPVLQAKVAVDPVTLISYNAGRMSQPLRALWLTNTTALTLDRGSFTLIENGAFAGEGLTDPIHANEKRLLSYAADQSVHVAIDQDKQTDRITLLRGSRGVINIHRADTHEIEFLIHNAAATRRTVITEVPVVAGYKIDSDPLPEETTATVYRWRTEVDPGQTVRLHVGGTRQGYTTYYLSRSDDSQLQLILNESGHNPQLEAALQPVIEARRRVADAQTAVDATTAQMATLRSDEDRQRANITALANADKSSRERFVRDLNATEDAITTAQTKLATQQAALAAAKAELASCIENFSIDARL